jgi:transcriptional regulator with XRE-family HTH domain
MAPFAARMGLRDDQARERIKKWFLQSKMTQKRFAERVGWTQPTMNSYLQGKHDTDLDTLAQMAKVFGKSLIDVVGADDTDADELISLLNGVEDDVRESALVVLRAARREARPAGTARRSLRASRGEA